MESLDRLYAGAAASFDRWETVREVVDELIDLALDHRQSGHPGGSRSKVHLLLALLLSGAMRWDVLRPWRRFADRLVLSAGHTVPVVYACLAVLNEAMRARHERSGDERFAFPDGGRWALTWENLLDLRRRGGLPGHAEMAARTLLLKWNTGPSGHGMPPAAGQALALRLAGAGGVRVFVIEGEGGLTPGASHETRNTAWGLGLDNLVFLVDWNDFGIDENPISSVVPGTPAEWFGAYGWRVCGTDRGADWDAVTRAVLEAAAGDNPDRVPSVAWFRTRKGRGYGKYDHEAHGSPHPRNGEAFRALRRRFAERHGVSYEGLEGEVADDPASARARAESNLRVAIGVLRDDAELVDHLSDRLVELAARVPERVEGLRVGGRPSIFADARLLDARGYPAAIWAAPGERRSNREALAVWGAFVNGEARTRHGRPLFVACSADLAASTGVAGFGEGEGWYSRRHNPRAALLPQQITEFTNAGLCAGVASVNLAEDPRREFEGLWAVCSTYGAFSYLKYGPLRLFSQLAQDCELRVGKVLWIAGHSGPETAEDSRTHFGVFAPGVTQLFPDGHVVDLHPWEYNEVPVVLAAALGGSAPIVALHLTRPAVEVPDRAALGIASHFEAARGAYVLREVADGRECRGTVFVQGTSTTSNVVRVLPELDRAGLEVRIVAAISPQLFALQERSYRERVASLADRWDSMVISNRSRRLAGDWITHPIAAEYSLTADHDDRWRTGGTVDEVLDEAHLSPEHLLAGIERFVAERDRRLAALRAAVDAAGSRR